MLKFQLFIFTISISKNSRNRSLEEIKEMERVNGIIDKMNDIRYEYYNHM